MSFSPRKVLMACGFAAAFCGDWFLAIRACGVKEPGFLCGVAAFACAHVLWAAANGRGTRIEWKALPVVLVPVLGFFAARVRGGIPDAVLAAVSAYAVVSAVSLAVAVGTRRWFYSLGIGCLVLSDVFIATRWAHAPHWDAAIGPVYLAALAFTAVSLFAGDREPRFACGRGNPLPVTALGGLLSVGCFAAAMAVCPGGGYNPLYRMLSYLGRTEIGGVAYPLSHYLFSLGLAAGAASTLYFAPHFRARVSGPVRKGLIGWGAAVCVSGLLLIVMVPENTDASWHVVGCDLAMGGGIPMAFALATDRLGRLVLAWFLLLSGAFGAVLALHAAKVLPFAPYVPTLQKSVILSFIVWQLAYALILGGRRPHGNAPAST